MNKYDEKSAIQRILRGGAVVNGKKITAIDCGIKTQGAVDFLVNNCGYYRG